MSQYAESHQRSYWLDLIRVVSIFLVVMLHVAAGLLNKWGKIPFSEWMAGNVYDSLARISVPLLFMVSGSLLLKKKEPSKEFFLKRASKLLIPFMVWSLIYLIWYCKVDAKGTCSNETVLRLLLLDGTYYHLWFLYTLTGLYLVTPLLRLITTSGDKSILWYFVALWLFFQPGMSIVENIWHIQIGVYVPMATGYIGFFVLGYLFSEISLPPRGMPLLFIIWFLSTAITVAGTYLISLRQGEFSGIFYDYLGINVILASVSAFILLKLLAMQKILQHPFITHWIYRIAARSFGIYLIHALVLGIIVEHIPLIQINVQMGYPLWSIPFVSAVTFTLSFLAVSVLQKIPFVHRIVP